MTKYYKNMVEHYLRLVMRYPEVEGEVPKKWYAAVAKWVESLSPSDKEFIEKTFTYDNLTVSLDWKMLHRLERDCAEYLQLI